MSHPDYLDMPQKMTDANQNVVWEAAVPIVHDAPCRRAPAMGLRFPGRYYGSELWLHYNSFRDYDLSVGRYTESDPIGLKGGLNDM